MTVFNASLLASEKCVASDVLNAVVDCAPAMDAGVNGGAGCSGAGCDDGTGGERGVEDVAI